MLIFAIILLGIIMLSLFLFLLFILFGIIMLSLFLFLLFILFGSCKDVSYTSLVHMKLFFFYML